MASYCSVYKSWLTYHCKLYHYNNLFRYFNSYYLSLVGVFVSTIKVSRVMIIIACFTKPFYEYLVFE